MSEGDGTQPQSYYENSGLQNGSTNRKNTRSIERSQVIERNSQNHFSSLRRNSNLVPQVYMESGETLDSRISSVQVLTKNQSQQSSNARSSKSLTHRNPTAATRSEQGMAPSEQNPASSVSIIRKEQAASRAQKLVLKGQKFIKSKRDSVQSQKSYHSVERPPRHQQHRAVDMMASSQQMIKLQEIFESKDSKEEDAKEIRQTLQTSAALQAKAEQLTKKMSEVNYYESKEIIKANSLETQDQIMKKQASKTTVQTLEGQLQDGLSTPGVARDKEAFTSNIISTIPTPLNVRNDMLAFQQNFGNIQNPNTIDSEALNSQNRRVGVQSTRGGGPYKNKNLIQDFTESPSPLIIQQPLYSNNISNDRSNNNAQEKDEDAFNVDDLVTASSLLYEQAQVLEEAESSRNLESSHDQGQFVPLRPSSFEALTTMENKRPRNRGVAKHSQKKSIHHSSKRSLNSNSDLNVALDEKKTVDQSQTTIQDPTSKANIIFGSGQIIRDTSVQVFQSLPKLNTVQYDESEEQTDISWNRHNHLKRLRANHASTLSVPPPRTLRHVASTNSTNSKLAMAKPLNLSLSNQKHHPQIIYVNPKQNSRVNTQIDPYLNQDHFLSRKTSLLTIQNERSLYKGKSKAAQSSRSSSMNNIVPRQGERFHSHQILPNMETFPASNSIMSERKQSGVNYGAKEELMSFIKQSGNNTTLKTRATSEAGLVMIKSGLNSNTSAINIPKLDLRTELLFQSARPSQEQQDSLNQIDYSASGHKLTKRNPIKETRLKNNRRLYEQVLKEQVSSRLKHSIAEYVDEKTANMTNNASTAQSLIQSSGLLQGQQSGVGHQRIPTKGQNEYNSTAAIEIIEYRGTENSRNEGSTVLSGAKVVNNDRESAIPSNNRQRAVSFERIEVQQNSDMINNQQQHYLTNIDTQPAPQRRKKSKQARQPSQKSIKTPLLTLNNNLGHVSERQQTLQQVVQQQDWLQTDPSPVRTYERQNLSVTDKIVVDIRPREAHEQTSYREFVSQQPQGLSQMVASKSRKSFSHLPEQLKSKQVEVDEGLSTNSTVFQQQASDQKSAKKSQFVLQNMKNLSKMQFMKDRQKKYCADQGQLSQEELAEYSRLQLIKNVQKSLPHMKLSKEQQRIQALTLKVIEETPAKVPHTEAVQIQIDELTEKMSFRKPLKIRTVNLDDQAETEKQEASQQLQTSVMRKMGQIQDMLHEMHVIKGSQTIEESDQNDVKDGDKQSQSESETPFNLQDDLDVILTQKDTLQQYVRQLDQVEKRRHRAYWETIKRVHAKLDAKLSQEESNKERLRQLAIDQRIFERKEVIRLRRLDRMKVKKTQLQLVQEERLRRRAVWEYRRRNKKLASESSSINTDDEKSEESVDDDKDSVDNFEKMHERVLKKVNKRKLAKRIEKLLLFQQELVAQFDSMQIDFDQVDDDDQNLDWHNITEQQLQERMARKLDRQVSSIFLKSEVFYQYHQELEMNIQLMKMNKVQESFVQEKKQQIENRVRQQLKELIPHLVTSAHILSGSQSSPLGQSSGTLTPESAFQDIKSQLKKAIRSTMQKSYYQQASQNEILEQDSERSESSSYLETDSDEKSNSDEERKSPKKVPSIVFNATLRDSQPRPPQPMQTSELRATSKFFIKKPSIVSQQSSSVLNQTMMHITDSFKPSVTLRSGSSYPSAVESSNLRAVEQALIKRQTVQMEDDLGALRAQQTNLVSAFSKTLARNLQTSIEANEQEYLKRMSKQLVKKAEFGKGFQLNNVGDDLQLAKQFNLDNAIRNYQHKEELKKQTKEKNKLKLEIENIKKKSLEELEQRSQMSPNSPKKGGSSLKEVIAVATNVVNETSKASTVDLFGANSSEEQIQDKVRQILAYDMKKIKNSITKEQRELLDEAKKMQTSTQKNQYVEEVIRQGRVPLPVLNKIVNKFLLLENYQIEASNFQTLAKALPSFIPNSMNKLVLIDNKLNDSSVATLFTELSELQSGPKILGIIKNMVGQETWKSAARFMDSEAASGISRLIFKDPSYISSKRPPNIQIFTRFLPRQGQLIYRLKELVLQGVGLSKQDVLSISEFATVVQSLKQLNISSNGLSALDFIPMFETMKPQAVCITHLNLSWNSMSDEGIPSFEQLDEFRNKFANFLRHSRTLQHLDLSGMGFGEATLKHITMCGFRKAKTLLSIHMSGNFDNQNLLVEFRSWMKVVEITRQISRDQPVDPWSQAQEHKQSPKKISSLERNILERHSTVPTKVLDDQTQPVSLKELENLMRDKTRLYDGGDPGEITDLDPMNNGDQIHDFRNYNHQIVKKQLKQHYIEAQTDYNTKKLQEANYEKRFAKAMSQGSLQANMTDRVVFQRFLGHYEIVNGYRWHEVDESDCFMCQQWSYCVFLYDKKLAQEEDIYFQVNARQIGNVRKRSTLCPSYVSIDSVRKVLPMLPIQSFLSRLAADKHLSGFKRQMKDHMIEFERKELTNKVELYEQRQSKIIKLESKGKSNLITPKPLKWHYLLSKYLKSVIHGLEPQGTIYNNNLASLFDLSCRDDTLQVCAAYLPPKMTSVVIQDQNNPIASAMFYEIFPQKYKKFPQKSTRKVQEVRKFNKANSVFKDYKEETDDMSRKQLEYDATLNKIGRFIKDQDERDRTYQVLLKYYRPLRDQFFTQISKADAYPVIDWIDFTNHCQIWDVINNNLKMSDIDRIFIATNVELEDQEANDDRSLCRFEFYEIITRMAKTKYFESKKVGSISEALEMILLESVLPNANMLMESVDWRQTFLWTLPVDDLYKANIENLRKVFGMIKAPQSRYIDFKNTLSFLGELPLEVSQDTITLAWAFSKMQFVEEMELIDKYEQMVFVEFIEFIGRLAWLIHNNPQEALDVKLWRVMQVLFSKIKEKVKAPQVDDEVDSESDYEDELATNVLKQKHPKDMYAGYGLLRSNFGKDDQQTEEDIKPWLYYDPNPWRSKKYGSRDPSISRIDESSMEGIMEQGMVEINISDQLVGRM